MRVRRLEISFARCPTACQRDAVVIFSRNVKQLAGKTSGPAWFVFCRQSNPISRKVTVRMHRIKAYLGWTEPTARCKDHNADSEWIHRFPHVDSNPRKPTAELLSLLCLSLIP